MVYLQYKKEEKMITENDVREVAIRFLGQDVDFRVSRAYGGFSEPCGYQLTVFGEDDSNQTFFHDGNTVDTLVSKMIPFVELLEDTILLGK